MKLHTNKIIIVGPPNVGKSIIFNKFSNFYSAVANYPHTTIEPIRKKAVFAGKEFEIIDTPGIFSLDVFSDDERLTRRILIDEHPELLIFCGDATRLKPSLVLLTQVLELGIPTIFCLSKVDLAIKKGVAINTGKLSEVLGIPVIETATIHGTGLKEIKESLVNLSPPSSTLHYQGFIEKLLENIRGCFPEDSTPSRALAILLLSNDIPVKEYLQGRYGKEILEKIAVEHPAIFRKTHPLTLRRAIFKAREMWSEELYRAVVSETDVVLPGFSAKSAWLSRHPVLGWPILLGIIWVTFKSVGTISTWMAYMMDSMLFLPFVHFISGLLSNPTLNEFLVGHYGILTMGVVNALGTVIPILLVFFLILNFLEDIGYLPNLGVLINRILKPVGLSGKAVLPMVLGFGCNTMATLTSRILGTRKERIIAAFLIALGFPCSVQLGVMLAILATAPFSALIIIIGSVAVTQIVAGLLLNRLIPSDQKADFIMELPSFTPPNWRNIFRKTYFRLKWFLMEALPMFILAAFIMFMLDKTGLLDLARKAGKPVITGILSLPEKMVDVFILVLSRREVGTVYFKEMVDAHEVEYIQTVVGLIVMTLFIPCLSNTMVMLKELGLRWTVFINIAIIAIAIFIGGIVNFIMRLI